LEEVGQLTKMDARLVLVICIQMAEIAWL